MSASASPLADQLELTALADELRVARHDRGGDVNVAATQAASHGRLQRAMSELAAAEDHVRRLAVAAYKHHGASKLVDLMLSAPRRPVLRLRRRDAGTGRRRATTQRRGSADPT